MLKIESILHPQHREINRVYDIDCLVYKEIAEYLYRVSSRLGPGNYVELGCCFGASSLCLATGIKDFEVDANLITIDTFDGRTLPKIYRGAYSIDTVRETFRINGFSDVITAVQGSSAEAAVHYQDKEFNFLFIDADHTYKGCKADFKAWSPLVKSGGEIVFHDNDRKGVRKVLRKVVPWKWEIKEEIRNLTVFIKP